MCRFARPDAKGLAEVAAVAALYIVTGKLGFLAAIAPGNVTAVWPPSGIALAAVLLCGNRAGIGIWLGSYVVNSWFFSGITNPLAPWALAVSSLIGIGSTLQALVGASLIRRAMGSRRPIDRPHDVFAFVGIEMASCLVAATIGVTSLCLGGFARWAAYGYTWLTWWLGDVSGVLVVTPAILAWSALRIRWSPWRAAEAALSLGALVVAGQMVFGELVHVGGLPFPLLYALLPLVMWAALRFGHGGVTISILIVSGMAIWKTANGVGPFAIGTLNESLLLLQAFVGIVAVTGLVLAAAVAEQEQTQAALRSARDELEKRVEERTAELSDSNMKLTQEVVERLQAEQYLIKAAKLESVGRLAAGVAHEVKNPLATLLLGLEHLSDQCGSLDDDTRLLLRDMQHAVLRADAVIRGLLNFSSTNELQAAHADLNAVVDQALILVKHEMDRAHVALVKECQPLPSCALDLAKVEQVFVNLFMNAIQAMPTGGTLSVRTYATPPRRLYSDPAAPDGASAAVREAAVVAEVEDTGSGIPEDMLSKVFDPFFTTKPTGKGTGLGLTVCKKIVELHRGRMLIANRPTGGIQVRLIFPLAASVAADEPAN